jgi:protein ImuB
LPLFSEPLPVPDSHEPLDLPQPERQQQLWLCLDFHRLALEVFAAGAAGEAMAVVDGERGSQRILICNDVATEEGVRPGLQVNAALALNPSLRLLDRDRECEQETVARLAAWACQFTSLVSLEPPRGLLLELGGSMKLFGGLDVLLARIGAGLKVLGFAARQALAPVPRAAIWLARGKDGVQILRQEELASQVGALSLYCTAWPRTTLDALRGMGIRRLEDILRLPRGDFARRLGPARLADLDRATGRLTEPRRAFRSPPVYRGRLDLPEESLDRELMAQGLERLLIEMEGFLRGRQAGVQRPVFGFEHRGTGVTRIMLGLSRPMTDAASIGDLLAERMERLDLIAPVCGLSLESGSVQAIEIIPRRFGGDFGQGEVVAEVSQALVDRLRSRLGDDAVRGVCLLAEHRPESAWAYSEPGRSSRVARQEQRPFWILETPGRLECRDGKPWLEGRLHLERGPERIESGWWDGGDISRDYFVASSPNGMLLWIFRDRRTVGRWFLH